MNYDAVQLMSFPSSLQIIQYFPAFSLPKDNRDEKISLKIKYEKKHIAGVKKRIYARIGTKVLMSTLSKREVCTWM